MDSIMRLWAIFLVSVISPNAVSNETPFIALPDAYTFENNVRKICESKPGLRICQEAKSGARVTYCNASLFDCAKLENHNTLKQFIALERRIDIDCIAGVNFNITVHKGKQTKFASYTPANNEECKVDL